MAKLTEARVRDMPPPEGGRGQVTVDGAPGLLLRIAADGGKTWWLRRQVDGRRRESQLGTWPAMSLVRAKAAAGAQRERSPSGPTMRELWSRYASEHLPKRRASTAEKDAERWRVHVEPALGGHRVDVVSRNDVAQLHATISRTAPGAANRVLSLLSKMFTLAERWGMRETANPARGHDRNNERQLGRYLTTEEYERILAALEAESELVRDVVLAVMHTGARVSEILNRTRGDADVERQRLRLGTSKTGPDWLTCSPDAWVVVRRRLALASRDPGTPLWPIEYEPLYRRWLHVRRRAELPDLRMHDLRHSFASVIAGAGGSLPQIGGLLRHKSPATTQRYVHLVDEAQRELAGKASSLIPKGKGRRKR